MFGYIRPVKSALLVKDSELYSAVYCGMCRYGGKNISHLTRWLLNYDFVLLALLRMAVYEDELCIQNKRCPYKLRKKSCVCNDKSYEFVCSAFGLLTYAKLEDDIKDEKGFKRFYKKTTKPIFTHIARKSDKFDGLKEIIDEGMEYTEMIEKEKCSSIDKAADGFATMMKRIAAYQIEDKKKPIIESCGYHIGRFIYIADALDDVEEDVKSGNYNPLLLKYGSLDNVKAHENEIKETLYDSLNAFSNHYALIAHTNAGEIDRLIYNIVELGGRSTVARIIERKNKK